MTGYRLELINNQKKLRELSEDLLRYSCIALDIETVDWWDRRREKIALVQLAYRVKTALKVAIIDTLAALDLEPLRKPLESKEIIKVIHNAAFDANKLSTHFKIQTAPIFDTMIAARWNREKKYSLKAQAALHLNIHLDKTAQRSDWGRRPLDIKQLDYAARDAYATFLLYENQLSRNLTGSYQTRTPPNEIQATLPLDMLQIYLESSVPSATKPSAAKENTLDKKKFPSKLSAAGVALLGIISKLPLRFGPEQLAVSVNTESRIGLAGWILDRGLGAESDLDEATARILIAQLTDLGLIEITTSRRLKTTEQGEELWVNLDFLK